MRADQAKLAIKNEDYQQAISILTELIGEDRSNFEYFALRAVAYRKIKSFQFSINDFNSAIAIAPRNADLRTEKGVSLFHQKNIDLALIEMNIAVELEPKNAYRYSSRAYIKDALKDVSGAIQDYQMAIKLDPEDAIALNNLGMLEEKKGNLDKAKKNFDKSDQLQGIDMKKITDEAVKNGGTSINKEEAKKEVIKLQGEAANAKPNHDSSSPWSIIKEVFSSKKVFKEFVDYLVGLFSKKNK